MFIFNKEAFLKWVKNKFPNTIDNHFTYDMMENIIDYAIERKSVAPEQLINFLSYIIPEVTEEEYMDFITVQNNEFKGEK